MAEMSNVTKVYSSQHLLLLEAAKHAPGDVASRFLCMHATNLTVLPLVHEEKPASWLVPTI
jgi:hypothetical protein